MTHVRRGQHATRILHMCNHCAGEVALVKGAGTFRSDQCKAVREIGHDNGRSGGAKFVVVMQRRITIDIAAKNRFTGIPQVVVTGSRQREPIARCSNRWLEYAFPGRAAKLPPGCLNGCGGAGYSH